MQDIFTKKTTSTGQIQYRNVTENKIVKKSDLSENLLARLDAADEGVHVAESAEILVGSGEVPVVVEGEKTRTIQLTHNLMVNGVIFEGGKTITVSSVQADDLIRIDREHSNYEAGLIKKTDKSRKPDVRPQDIQ